MSKLSKIIKISIIVPIILLAFEAYMSQYKYYQQSNLGITQPQVSQRHPEVKHTQLMLIDASTGSLALNGWDHDIEDNIFINYEDATPISKSFYQLNNLKYKAWDYILIHTQKHVIQVNFVDLSFICPTSIVILEKANPRQTLIKISDNSACASIDKHRLTLGDKGVQLNGNKIKAAIKKLEGRNYQMTLESKQIDLKINLTFNIDESQSAYYSLPLSADKTSWFATLKYSGLSSLGSYTYHGKSYTCGKGQDCLMMVDNGRGHQPYGMGYYWVMLMHRMEDGRVVTLNLNDGLSTNYRSLDKASGDFIIIGGTYYKLDIHHMIIQSNDQNDFFGPRKFMTAQEDEHYKRRFPYRNCSIQFTPVGDIEDGVNLVVFAVRQFFAYGYFDVTCVIDGEYIEFKKAFGHVEHVYSRW